ncbi:B12-binding domain-containing radical SAM protein, partial [Candidatus Omnitrophota bacterium]
MKVLFIDPPFYRLFGYYNRYFPYGIAALGKLLKNEGFNVLVYDADANVNPTDMDYSRLSESYAKYLKSFRDDNNPVWNEVEEVIKKFNPDVVGISIWTTYAASAFHVAKLSKKVCPASTVVMGGPHATVKPDEVLEICPHVDYIIRGEGEITILELLRHL